MVTLFRKYIIAAFFLALFLTPQALPAFAQDDGAQVRIDDVRFGLHPGKTRMVLDLTRVSDYRVFTLSDPYRIVIDLPRFSTGIRLADKIRSHQKESNGETPVSNLRWGHLNPDISRMVVDLSSPVRVDTTFLLPAKANFPPRLVIDFKQTTVSDFAKARQNVFGTLTIDDIQGAKSTARSGPAASHTAAPPVKPQKASMVTPPEKPMTAVIEKPLIILDPGHGGVDPGAIGANGVKEKDIVLKLSHELRRQLLATGKFRVKMTREDDRFLRLRDRVAFARRHKGDLFISVHADSLRNPRVSGASVYTLSETASDAQTAKLAKRENQADLIAGVDLASEGPEVANILIDLAMRDTMNQSSFFANTLVETMQASRINTLENPHRFAGFAVLKAADIPSVLVEAGFISNRREARMLAKSSYRRSVAEAIVAGILEYHERVERNRRS